MKDTKLRAAIAGFGRKWRWGIAVAAFAIDLCCATDAAAQQNVTVSFSRPDSACCDANGRLQLFLKMSEEPRQNTVNIQVVDNTGNSYNIYFATERMKGSLTWPFELSRPHLTHSEETGFEDLWFEIKTASMTSSEGQSVPINIGEPHRLNMHLYGTPTPPADETAHPWECRIENDNRACGYDANLKANDAWAAHSTYEWSCSGNALFSIEEGADQTQALLKQRRDADGYGSPLEEKVTVTLIQTVGGICKTEVSKQLTLTGQPIGTLSQDPLMNGEEIIMCSAVDSTMDLGRFFGGIVDLEGLAPFKVELSTGDKYEFKSSGANAFAHACGRKTETVVISRLTDRNGCEADEGARRGGIEVIDRKPYPSFAEAEITIETTHKEIEVQAWDEANTFTWGVGEQSRGFDCGIGGYGHRATVRSNMNVPVDYWVIETNTDGVDCPSDTAWLRVQYAMPFRYPNGISPNGDGVNDRLVIEGLPAKNRVEVVDSRGKSVYVRNDYRNDWSAEGVDDGYYVYLFKGEGTPTLKETLVIKRTR